MVYSFEGFGRSHRGAVLIDALAEMTLFWIVLCLEAVLVVLPVHQTANEIVSATSE
jgi:hypothetical protein